MQNQKKLRYISMIIVDTNPEKTFPIIPIRQIDDNENDIYVDITNETTKEVFTRLITYRENIKDIYYIGAETFDFFSENVFFTIKVYFDATFETIYKDRMFCTNQNIDTFTINENQYNLPTINNNTYITI
jgi:hypothetical protein